MSDDLSKLGFSNNKTKKCNFNFSSIPSNLFPHFLRGFFDGDGSIFITKYNSVNVHFIGLPNIIEYIHSYLKNNDISSAIYPCYSSYIVNELRIGNIHEIVKFYDLIYNDAILLLDRKRKKFEMGFDILRNEIEKLIKDGRYARPLHYNGAKSLIRKLYLFLRDLNYINKYRKFTF